MTRGALALAVLAAASPGHAEPAPVEASILIAPPAEVAGIAERLAGHRFRTGDGVVIVDDVAGAGRPWTGVVERRGEALWLVTALGPLELTGALARPRIAGPGYTIWAVGVREGSRLAPTRIGILRRPDVGYAPR